MRRVWQSLIAVGLVVGLECGAQEIPDQELLEAVLTDLQPGTRWRSFKQMKSVGMRKTKYVGIEQGAAMYCYPVKLPGYAGRECIAAVLKSKPAVIREEVSRWNSVE